MNTFKSKYTIILHFIDSDLGYTLMEETLEWLDDLCIDNIYEEDEYKYVIEKIDYINAKKVLDKIKKTPDIMYQLLQVSEIVEHIPELPHI